MLFSVSAVVGDRGLGSGRISRVGGLLSVTIGLKKNPEMINFDDFLEIY